MLDKNCNIVVIHSKNWGGGLFKMIKFIAVLMSMKRKMNAWESEKRTRLHKSGMSTAKAQQQKINVASIKKAQLIIEIFIKWCLMLMKKKNPWSQWKMNNLNKMYFCSFQNRLEKKHFSIWTNVGKKKKIATTFCDPCCKSFINFVLLLRWNPWMATEKKLNWNQHPPTIKKIMILDNCTKMDYFGMYWRWKHLHPQIKIKKNAVDKRQLVQKHYEHYIYFFPCINITNAWVICNTNIKTTTMRIGSTILQELQRSTDAVYKESLKLTAYKRSHQWFMPLSWLVDITSLWVI